MEIRIPEKRVIDEAVDMAESYIKEV